MRGLTVEDARRVLDEWSESFGRATSMQEWSAHVTEHCTEFHPIYPALIEARMFDGLQGTRFKEPRFPRGPRIAVTEEVIRVFGDAILRVTAGTLLRLETDGTVTYHLVRETLLFVRVDGRWLMAHNHISPPGNDPPYGHNQFATGSLQYTK